MSTPTARPTGARTPPPRGPARRRHDVTRQDVARKGLPGPEGMASELLDWVTTALAVPEAGWVFADGTWRLATRADDWPDDQPDDSTATSSDSEIDTWDDALPDDDWWRPKPGSSQHQFAERTAALARFTAWLDDEATAADRARVTAVLAERAAMVAAQAHVDDLRRTQVGIGRAEGAQLRVLSKMASLYREAVRLPNDPDDATAAASTGDPRSVRNRQRLQETLEAAGLRDLVAEVALALGWTTTTASLLVRLCEHVVVNLPRTLERLESGRLLLSLVKIIAERSLDLSAQHAREVDDELFGPDGSGVGLNSAQLRIAVDAAVARKDATAVRRRSRRKTTARNVTLTAVGDGISCLTFVGPTPALAAAFEGLDAVAAVNLAEARRAREEGRVPADGGDPYAVPGVDVADPHRVGDLDAPLADHRGMPAHRFDAFVTAMAGARPAEPGSTRPEITMEMHVALTTLCGEDDEPGWLEGYGWIPAWLVRQGLTWKGCRLRRLLVDPFTGDLETVDGHTYPASWLTDPDQRPPRGGTRRPGGDPQAPPGTTFHGQPIQRLPPQRTEDDVLGPAVEVSGPPGDPRDPGDDSPARGELLADDDLPTEADTVDPCTAGTCTPLDPLDCPLTPVGGGQYSPPPVHDRWLRRRWQHCSFPGCTRRAGRCDLDHVVAYRAGGPKAGGGTTCSCNLEPKCRAHHLLKHATDPLTHRNSSGLEPHPEPAQVRWSARWRQWRCDVGSSHWRSPLGLDHHTRPRPTGLPAERFRPTPWPPRHPDHDDGAHDPMEPLDYSAVCDEPLPSGFAGGPGF